MKSFQFYSAAQFPSLSPGIPIVAYTQNTFVFFEEPETVTTLCLEKKEFSDSIDLLRIVSDIVFNSIGYIHKEIEGQRKRLDFSRYNRQVDFFGVLRQQTENLDISTREICL